VGMMRSIFDFMLEILAAILAVIIFFAGYVPVMILYKLYKFISLRFYDIILCLLILFAMSVCVIVISSVNFGI
jgi:hypothetical protein